ncbi:NAD(P)-binding protein [Penicillium nucicola]|uniref:NAD(P)-binding protein n=1 Tax=Penicillium nucicola TaxID=1850975 RepID=UPI0025459F70|nr:NAD(P)-binding protein [Penicillium nucicola]KAJ5770685.1 NAD(P)-binding protein [Penicillium nucicola]
MVPLLIYGATGYTGRMASEQAKSTGLDFALAGRTESKLKDLASRLEVSYYVFDLSEKVILDSMLKNTHAILNCAGPFIQTAKPLMEACLRNKTHYLDISAELATYQQAQLYDNAAQRAGIMLLPGCGGSVAMLGCLASHVIDQVNDPQTIDIALHVAGSMSRGSAISASSMTAGCLQLVDGRLVEQDMNQTAGFDFGDGNGNVESFPVTLPDLLTIGKASNIANIRAFVHVSGDAFSKGDIELLSDGPTAAERGAAPYHAVAIVTSKEGVAKRAALHTLNGYTFTCLASVEAARRVLENETKMGFQTPVVVFGKDFLRAIPSTEINDLQLGSR